MSNLISQKSLSSILRRPFKDYLGGYAEIQLAEAFFQMMEGVMSSVFGVP
jgi:hypothetical protein